jgi:hypothetical protein
VEGLCEAGEYWPREGADRLSIAIDRLISWVRAGSLLIKGLFWVPWRTENGGIRFVYHDLLNQLHEPYTGKGIPVELGMDFLIPSKSMEFLT